MLGQRKNNSRACANLTILHSPVSSIHSVAMMYQMQLFQKDCPHNKFHHALCLHSQCPCCAYPFKTWPQSSLITCAYDDSKHLCRSVWTRPHDAICNAIKTYLQLNALCPLKSSNIASSPFNLTCEQHLMSCDTATRHQVLSCK